MNTILNYSNVCWINLQNIATQKAKFYDYNDDDIPVFSTYELGHIQEGVSFNIYGFMPFNCERFAIHLILNNPSRDIALRINPRLPQNYVVRNSRVKRHWGVDENASCFFFNLKRGSYFVIQIVVTSQRYMISLNNIHFAKFHHRVPFEDLACIKVYGDVKNVHVVREEVTKYPAQQNINFLRVKLATKSGIYVMPLFSRYSAHRRIGEVLGLPYYGVMPKRKLDFNKHIRIEGRVKLLPWSFYVNLQNGQNVWPHPIVPLHVRCRFAKHHGFVDKNVIIRNAWHNGKWQHEEITELTADIFPAENFSLVIVRKTASYEIYINRKFIVDFEFRINPDIADTVYVLGDICLSDVVLEDHKQSQFYRKQETRSFADFLRTLL